MKQLFVLLMGFVVLTGCSKDDADTTLTATKATVDYTGDPALSGFGWTLRIGTDFEVPTNLADEYKVDELPVIVTFKKTDRLVPCRCVAKKYLVEIISISRG